MAASEWTSILRRAGAIARQKDGAVFGSGLALAPVLTVAERVGAMCCRVALSPLNRASPRRACLRGGSLIEVLVALAITALGTLALLGLTVQGLRQGRSGDLRLQASLLATDLAEHMRANPLGRQGYWRAPSPPGAELPEPLACAQPTQCTPAELAQRELVRWLSLVRAQLPGGVGHVTPATGTQPADVWVIWRDTAPGAVSPEAACPPGLSAPLWRCLSLRVGS